VNFQPSESYFSPADVERAPEKKPLHTVFGKVHKKHLVCFVINIWVFLAGHASQKPLLTLSQSHSADNANMTVSQSGVCLWPEQEIRPWC